MTHHPTHCPTCGSTLTDPSFQKRVVGHIYELFCSRCDRTHVVLIDDHHAMSSILLTGKEGKE